MLDLTVCLPVCNDEVLLKRSLDLLNGQVAQILILDFGSTDGSLLLAKAFGCETLSLSWENHWGQVWQQAAEHFQHSHVLWLHPGEEPQAALGDKLPGLLASGALDTQDWICETPREISSEARIFLAQDASLAAQRFFPLFRDHADRSNLSTWGKLLAKEISWSRSPEVVGPLLDAALTEPAPDARIRLLAAIRAFERQNDSLAVSLFQALVDQADTVSEQGFSQLAARLYQLKVLWEKGLKQETFEQLDRFRQKYPQLEQQPGLWVLRGVMARQVQEKELARECFQKALELADDENLSLNNPLVQKPDISWKPWLGLGEIYLEEGQFSQAYHAFVAARKTLPDHPHLAAQFLRSAFLTGHYAELQEVLFRFDALPGFTPGMRVALAAISGQAIEIEPLALAEMLLQEIKSDAQVSFSQSSNPMLLSVVLEYTLLLLRAAKYPEARMLLQHLTLRLPGQAMLWHNLAFSYFAQQNYLEAEKYYRQALQVQPDFIESRMDLGKVLVMQGKIEAACEEFEEILVQNPRFAPARKALAQLQEIPAGLPGMPSIPGPVQEDAAPEAPFVFLFPLSPTWENGIDIALRAFYEEFVAGDNVILVVPDGEAAPAIERARNWAEQKFTPDLLPAVVQLKQALPLLAHRTCLLLPARLQPASELLKEILDSDFSHLVTGLPLSTLPMGYLPSHCHSSGDPEGASVKVWWEVETELLKNQMRLLLEQETSEPSSLVAGWDTHKLIKKAKSLPSAQMQEMLLNADAQPEIQISVCMIVKDEARFLPSCLESFADQVDEIIVVDTGSRDQTREIARSFEKVRLFEKAWHDDFAEARNAALEQATCPWILVLDADEYLPVGFIPSLRQYLAHHRPEVDAYVFSVVALDEEGQETAQDTLPVPRLFANSPDLRFKGRIHELLTHAQHSEMVYVHLQGLPIYHRGYQEEIRQEKQKLQRDTALMERMLAEAPEAQESERMYLILGLAQEQAENWDKALDYYRLGLEHVAEDSSAHATLQKGVWRIELKRGDPRSIYKAVKPEFCEDPEVLLLWAEAAQSMGLLDEALKGYELALALSDRLALKPDLLGSRPKRAWIFEKLVQAYHQLGQPATALYFSERLVKDNPAVPEHWHLYRELLQRAAQA
ncbi:hypothetical protein COW36_04560 [bacterium (Candidatus Blackallbacteria) CG17_big_fil_post_rev_8_21_14_2_50_48_46]|uniref:Glycosyltransferase 2-like domain-containing protein n=1 Tax=bacterium (Candidatus Blackallbacteria) CG17_big_fil_post_rev_8_21_14_2_50_48_46 TaxID=2014261 RepID=A0A2M7G8Y6_9BACT|nr:MAG: hypothetical protein COW64_04385 [bacterium (Candidatus Blackallbacteria) CG18_big_fil_WC_8_21_14_2_50_49_26]PIW18569.1 MAG: hypothetical protein COW36_04560 [bacterium (Candidatus Blackallbacteria) CG17_big_fil_post_rev_8_21_14_2_50_48_46]PIW46446.1 MAG: hypothetical protein COW20_16120 [bacterium (Candidatus Blackallbacteria) CG13_big_fil_rev_8_21_14_2_50_49_14]